MSLNTQQQPMTPLGYEQFSSFDSAAVKLSIPTGCTHILWRAETASVRWRDDGTDPTTTVGMLITVGNEPHYYPGDPEQARAKLRVIGTGATAILHVAYYKA